MPLTLRGKKRKCMNEKSFGSKALALPQFFKSLEDEKVRTIQAGLKFFQPVCLYLCQFRVLKKSGLGKPFGKASLANPVFGLGRFISMGDRSSWTGECRVRYPSDIWPDEALERGLPKPWTKGGKN